MRSNIENIIHKKSIKTKKEYEVHLKATLDCIRWLLKQGLPFCGNEESTSSFSK